MRPFLILVRVIWSDDDLRLSISLFAILFAIFAAILILWALGLADAPPLF